jgi:CheY-like chemotaxis protein
MTKPKILLVEDSNSVAQHIKRILSTRSYQVTHAVDGQAGWEVLQAGPTEFEAIVLDREMPRMNGLELLKLIKATPGLRHVPVVMATTLADKKSVLEGLAEGAYYYLAKPFQAEVLLSVVMAACDHFREYRMLQTSIDQAERPFELLDDAAFRFRSLEDGRLLSKSLARVCPEPERAVVGLQELLVNAVEHGNLGIGYKDKSELTMNGVWAEEVTRRLDSPQFRDRYVVVQFARQVDRLLFTITDQGNGFDWEKYLDFDAERAFDSHGRGIAIGSKMSFDAIQYQGRGNSVVATILRR